MRYASSHRHKAEGENIAQRHRPAHSAPNRSGQTMWAALRVWISAGKAEVNHPVDGASAAAFRVIFGALGLAVVIRYFAHGWIGPLYVEPAHHFTYLGFGWLRPWPGPGMYVHFAVLGLLSLGIAAGCRPRICAALFFVGFTYIELLDRATYLNHHYLICLVSLLLAALPLHRNTIPAWSLWGLRAQVGVVYIFAGVAKLNPDWLFNALPLRIWLYQHGDLPIVGPLLREAWMAYAMSWSGAAFDLAIVPALLWRRTQPYAYGVLVSFHVATWALFPQLGIFPWLMIGLTLILFAPEWPRRVMRPLRLTMLKPGEEAIPREAKPWLNRATFVALALFAAVQLALPLRHYVYPGNVRWTEEGYLFAWRVMLTEKVGFVRYGVRDSDTQQSWIVEPGEYLTSLQVERMAFQPELIRQTADFIADDFADRGHPDVAVTADAFVAFNGRPNTRLIDPTVDLAATNPGLAPAQWVLPHGFEEASSARR